MKKLLLIMFLFSGSVYACSPGDEFKIQSQIQAMQSVLASLQSQIKLYESMNISTISNPGISNWVALMTQSQQLQQQIYELQMELSMCSMPGTW